MSDSSESLVRMANDIAAYFATEPDREVAVRGMADHIRRFWEPRMRRKLDQHLTQGGAGLSELALAAARALQVPA